MADPVVHLTNGVPDSGTGNITTLGQTLLDGANQTIGSTGDAAWDGASAASAISIWKYLGQKLEAVRSLLSGTLSVVTAQGFGAAVSFARTADTNAYAANDVVGSATGSTAALTFANMGPSGKEIMITSVALEIDDTAIIAGETNYRLYLYNATPPSALGDNAAFDLPSGDRASYLGYVDLGAPIDLGSTLYVETNGVNKQVTLSGTNLFGYLVTNGAYTPTSGRVYKVTLHAAS